MTAHNLRGQYGGFFSRMSAFIVDSVIITLIVLLTNWLISRLLQFYTPIQIGSCEPIQGFDLVNISCHLTTWTLSIFTAVFPFFYFLSFWILAGRTPGQFGLGIAVVRLDGRRITFFSGMLRMIGYVIGFLSLGIGFLWILVDDRRQGWHDKIAKTCVIYTWEGRQDDQFVDRVSNWINRRKTVAVTADMGDSNQQIAPGGQDGDEPAS